MQRMTTTPKRRAMMIAAGSAAAAVLLASCGNGDGDSGGGDGELSGADLIVGSKEFTESRILGQITAVVLEDAGASITDETGLSGTATVREALEQGEIDMYWDYTGTGWVNILENTTEDLPEDLYEAVTEEDSEENDIAWLEPAPFENTYRIAAKEDFASSNGLETTSEAADFINDNPDEGKVCAASEFINRDDGLPGLEEAYGFEFSEVVELDLDLIYTQVGDTCEFGEVFSTDARIESNELLVLEDDDDFFVPYQGAMTLREETLDEYPEIEDLIAPVSEALTDDVLIELNGRVDNEGEDERDVAEDWLEEEGIV